jgi:hypothetical protein
MQDQIKPFDVTQIEDDIRELTSGQIRAKQPRLPLLIEREKTHGSFHDVASFAQVLKTMFRTMPKWANMEPEHKEAIDLMCTKFGRIISGNPMEEEHWKDLMGYAELGREVCKE